MSSLRPARRGDGRRTAGLGKQILRALGNSGWCALSRRQQDNAALQRRRVTADVYMEKSCKENFLLFSKSG